MFGFHKFCVTYKKELKTKMAEFFWFSGNEIALLDVAIKLNKIRWVNGST